MSQHEDTVRELIQAVEDGDEVTIRRILADELAAIGSDRAFTQDRMVESMLDLHTALSGLEYTVNEILHDDGTYVVNTTLEGEFNEPFAVKPRPDTEKVEIEPNGEPVSGPSFYHLRFNDDGEVDAVGSYGDMPLLMEMGVIEFAGPTQVDTQAEPAED